MALTLQDYKKAIYALDACNASGVAHDLAQLFTKLWDTPEARQLGTEWVTKHPLVKLYVLKLFDLVIGEGKDFNAQFEEFSRAYQFCKEQLKKEEEPAYRGEK